MSAGQIIVLLAFSFSNSLSAFIFAAREKGWKRGEMFEYSQIPTFVSIACIFFLIGKLFAAITAGQISIFWPLWCIPAHIFGGMMVMAVFRSLSGMISIVLAPLLSITSAFFNL